jgi:hypothetical protein
MNWSGLPYEMEEAILSRLQLWELAEASSTCKRFDQIFRERLAKEQKSRCDLAITCFGKERVARIADIANRFSRGHALALEPGEDVRGRWSSMFADGKLHLTQPRNTSAGNAVDVLVWVPFHASSHSPSLIFEMFTHTTRGLRVEILRNRDPHGKRCVLSVKACNDRDVTGAALVQALMSGDFAPIVGEDWPLPEVHMMWGKKGVGLTSGGLRAQIAPLLPLAESFEVCKRPRNRRLCRARRGNKQGVSGAKRLIALRIRGFPL